MKFDQELVEYIDYTFNQLGELMGMEGKVVKIPADLFVACKMVTDPEGNHEVEEEFIEMKKTQVVNLIFEAHGIIHEEDEA